MLFTAACGSPAPEHMPPAKPAPSPEPAQQQTQVATPAERPTPDQEVMAKARKRLAEGRAFYQRGRYKLAEQRLKEVITLYPFLPDANVLLGKIFLVLGASGKDPAMIESARLMFEMALALDPNRREARLLLELFQEIP